jgi:hypothetical protein
MGKTVGNLWDFSGKLEKKGTQGFCLNGDGNIWKKLMELGENT